MKTLKTVIVVTLIIAAGFGANAQLTGTEIVEKAYNRETGDDQTSNLSMTLINRSGAQRIRKIKQFSKDLGEVEKNIMFFLSPADVKNTSFMSWSYDTDQSDDQWIYLPALKKTKRISSDSKSDYFMGSDFTYDDLGDRKLEDDTHKLLREETIDGKACFVVESVSNDDEYMYSKTVTWIIKDNFIGLKKEFYDEDEDLLKILSIKEFKEVSGFLIITNSEMENVQKNHKTSMVLSDVQINTGIPASKFTERMMMRGL
ncbi:MAG: outer membrane lipoprotein-sorting protein [Prolixibacteraceae bacterium]|jgi:outer membrane lipoprotein-sorting protein|nr:outer membrane lipoprotein-sorting protein [Prolixibacteraceae bacterium]MBT6764715.1 outer membrane lipoprotein-sorting protein [Prolixibacteraceae bacterium]MBT6997285.1 outer membrane lipoprotein-sorting protein [Prolixibacteraceae bacterium]MBT7394697.1 outer membrane lipoprotein-sorting protein [Prolixibacteraceae bacterium]